MGATIHDVAQVVGAGYSLSPAAGVGLKTSLQDVTQLGWRPVVMMFLVTLALALMAGGYLMAVR